MSDYKDLFIDNDQHHNNNDNIDFKENLEKYLAHYKWFLLSIFLCLILGIVFIKYAKPVYQSTATILLKKDKSGGPLNEISMLQDLGVGAGNNFVEDEIQIIKSIPIISNVVGKLNLNIKCYKKTSITHKVIEVYSKSLPFYIVHKKLDSSRVINSEIKIKFTDKNQFTVSSDSVSNQKYRLGQTIKIGADELIFVPKADYNKLVTKDVVEAMEYNIMVIPFDIAVDNYRNDIQVNQISKTSNAVELSLKSEIQAQGRDILNVLVQEYIANGIVDKNQVALKTAEFINKRIVVLDDELNVLEKNVENFKKQNNLTDIVSEAKLFVEGHAEIETKIQNNNIQLGLIKYMQDYLSKTKEDLIPTNIGLSDLTLAKNIEMYNELLLKKRMFAKSVTAQNPEWINLANSVVSLRKNIIDALENQRKSFEITSSNLQSQNTKINSKISDIPVQERKFREIYRPQQTKEALFLFLLQKREEATITSVSTLPSAKIINKANGLFEPIFPKKSLILGVFLFIGILIPFLIIFIGQLLDTKIHNIGQLEKLTSVPIIGNVAKGTNKTRSIVEKNDRTNVGESLRHLIANLNFVTNNAKNSTILVTSTMSGEGKSFVAANLATYLAHSGYKVVLLGLDLRAPKLYEYFNIDKAKGITHFITDKNLTVKDIINPIREVPNLDLIDSGFIIPNFNEIIQTTRLTDLVEELKKTYDYVIFDTAPVGLVSDTLHLNNLADLCLFVVRANYLDKRMLFVVEKIKTDKRFKKINLILNDVDFTSNKYGYGYGYGYGLEENDTSWFSKIFKIFKRK